MAECLMLWVVDADADAVVVVIILIAVAVFLFRCSKLKGQCYVAV